jgi:hypothetical protein
VRNLYNLAMSVMSPRNVGDVYAAIFLSIPKCSSIAATREKVINLHEVIADPTIADAVLDRLVHNAHRFR